MKTRDKTKSKKEGSCFRKLNGTNILTKTVEIINNPPKIPNKSFSIFNKLSGLNN